MEYLESSHAGDFVSGDKESVTAAVETVSQSKEYRNPTETLPVPPPPSCPNSPCKNCVTCTSLNGWWSNFKSIVDGQIPTSVHQTKIRMELKTKHALTKVVLIIFGESVGQDFLGLFSPKLRLIMKLVT